MKDVTVRKAVPEDSREVWEWWNDPLTRQMMKKNEHVPWDEHCRWWDGLMKDLNRHLYMGLLGGKSKLGVTRFDLRSPEVYEVSINLNPAERGKGYGSVIIEKGIEDLISHCKVKLLWAACKRINVASRKSFEKAGFHVAPNAERDAVDEDYLERSF